MYFYHEHYRDHFAVLEEQRCHDSGDDSRAYEPISIPAIVNWVVMASVALCSIAAIISGLM